MGSHSVTCSPTQMNTPQLGWPVLDLPTLGGMEGRVDLGDWLHTEMVYSHTDGHCIQVA